MNPFPAIWPPATLPLLSSLDTSYHLGANFGKKNYLQCRETCFLSTWLEDGFKGKATPSGNYVSGPCPHHLLAKANFGHYLYNFILTDTWVLLDS